MTIWTKKVYLAILGILLKFVQKSRSHKEEKALSYSYSQRKEIDTEGYVKPPQ